MTLEAKIDNLEKQLKDITTLLQLSINSLTTKKEVAGFLNKSEKTIDNYIKNNTFVENKHYFINENNRVEFISQGIIDFKRYPKHKIKVIENNKLFEDKLILSKTSSRILKGILA
ncbi:hypothetical protein AAX26_01169 [Aliarcobacter thereius]|uniref:Uncharacterized protein n=1 Tax=Aliarcobacter thereius TaxID=544718 RepID=A0A5R9GZ83_9BACT|nr:hypothetical protein [Aliarcobacter thereius]OCL86863.1 hypothetical protein AAX26_01169 [Aliarcobacter thereius]OCL90906.1 hypothetical protein AAX25_01074 [Aliarcobacter thereius]TLS72149.1 hypothetical protein FE246_06905 [Aliarcobacter thereius]